MKPEIVHRLHRHFEDYVQNAEGAVEFRYAKDLQELQDNKDWQNYLSVIEKARESCQTAKHEIIDHFVDINKMVSHGSEWYALFSEAGAKISGYKTKVGDGV